MIYLRLRNYKLNPLHLENASKEVAIKVNGQLTKRMTTNNVEVQGSFWGSLKCTVSMDKINKIVLADNRLLYEYSWYTTIQLRVLGMVNDAC